MSEYYFALMAITPEGAIDFAFANHKMDRPVKKMVDSIGKVWKPYFAKCGGVVEWKPNETSPHSLYLVGKNLAGVQIAFASRKEQDDAEREIAKVKKFIEYFEVVEKYSTVDKESLSAVIQSSKLAWLKANSLSVKVETVVA